jgi:hypothetical protein
MSIAPKLRHRTIATSAPGWSPVLVGSNGYDAQDVDAFVHDTLSRAILASPSIRETWGRLASSGRFSYRVVDLRLDVVGDSPRLLSGSREVGPSSAVLLAAQCCRCRSRFLSLQHYDHRLLKTSPDLVSIVMQLSDGTIHLVFATDDMDGPVRAALPVCDECLDTLSPGALTRFLNTYRPKRA